MSSGSLRATVSGLFVALVLATLSFLPSELPTADALKRPGELPYEPLGPLFGGVPVVQEFVAVASGLDAVELELATYRRRNKGLLTLSVSKFDAGRWKPLAQVTIAKRELDDNVYHRFEFGRTLPVARGNRVAIALAVNGSESSAITWYYTPGWHIEEGALRVGERVVDGTAHFQPLYRSRGTLGAKVWSRLTLLLGPVASGLLAVSGLVALGLFFHLTVWRVGRAADETLPGA